MDILEQERSVTVPAMETCWHGIVTTKAPFLKVVYRLVFCQQNVLDGANPCMNSDKQKKQSLSHGRGVVGARHWVRAYMTSRLQILMTNTKSLLRKLNNKCYVHFLVQRSTSRAGHDYFHHACHCEVRLTRKSAPPAAWRRLARYHGGIFTRTFEHSIDYCNTLVPKVIVKPLSQKFSK